MSKAQNINQLSEKDNFKETIYNGAMNSDALAMNSLLCPDIFISSNHDTLCVGQSALITANCTLNCTGITYTWQPGGSTLNAISVAPSTTTTYTLTGVSGGCTTTTTKTIIVEPIPNVNAVATPPNICAGQCSVITATSDIPGTTFITVPGFIPGIPVTVCPASTLTYTVAGTALGCTGKFMFTITVYPVPVVTASASPPTVCSGQPSTLTATSTITGTAFTWNPGSLSGSPVTAHPINTTTYTVIGNASGCGDTAMVTVNVNPLPVLTPVASPAAICIGSCSSLSVSSNIPGTTFTWVPGNVTGATISACPTTTTTYTVTGLSPAGCSSSTTLTLTVNPIPVVGATANPTAICFGTSTILTGNSNLTGTTYNWQPGNVAGSPVTVSPALTTIYTVTGTASGCSATDTVTVTVKPNPVITPTANPTVICDGSNSSLSATSSLLNTTYVWNSPTQTGNPVTVSPTATTTFSVVGTANGCTGSATVVVNVNPKPLMTPLATPSVICYGQSSVLSVTSNIPGTSFNWAPGGTGNPITVTPAYTTSYIVTGTSPLGCTNTAMITVTVNPIPVITPSATPSSMCDGGSSVLTGYSNQINTTYEWFPPSPAPSIPGNPVTVSPSDTTTYTVVGTAAGCSGSNTVTVTIIPVPVLTPTATPQVICVGDYSTVCVSSNVVGTTYLWGGSIAQTCVLIQPTATTEYTVYGYANGCSSSATITVTVNPHPVISATADPPVICSGQTSILTGSSNLSGTTYSWVPGNSTDNPYTVSPTSNTDYVVTGTTLGCTGSATVSITVNPNPTISPTASPPIICFSTSSQLDASSSVPGTTFTWQTPDTLIPASPITVTPLSTATYTVTGTMLGCTGSATITINVSTNPVISATSSADTICEADTVTLTGHSSLAGTSFGWSPGSLNGTSVSVTPSIPTQFTVIGDLSGCKDTATVYVYVKPKPIITSAATPSSICKGESTNLFAASTITGTDFLWSDSNTGSPVAETPSATTTYSVTGTYDGCTGTSSVTVTVKPLPVIDASATDIDICAGTVTTLSVTSDVNPTTFTWSDNQTGTPVNVSPNTTTLYTVTGSASGCTATDTITITVHAFPVITPTATPAAICMGDSSVLSATCSVGGINLTWDPGAMIGTPVTVHPTTTTIYTISGQAAGCSGSAMVTVTVNPAVTAVISHNDISCFGFNNGMAWVNVITGSTPYTYHWNTGSGNDTITGLSAIQYSVTITDVNGCAATEQVTITEPNALTLSLTPVNENCLHNCDGSVNATVNGGTAPISFLWSNGATTHNITNLCGNTYSLTITDANLCTTNSSTIVATNYSLDASCTADSLQGMVPLTVNFTSTSTGANSYSWDFGDGTAISTDANPQHLFSTAGTYTVVLTANSGAPSNCTDTAILIITVHPPALVEVPNVFTPNQDGMNDKFTFKTEGIKSLTCNIFDRWGKMIYEFTDASAGWEGKTKGGAPSAEGVYYYLIVAKGFDKTTVELTGTITLLR